MSTKTAVEKKYRDAGWTIISCPRDAPQDYICGMGKSIHFVKLSLPDYPGLFIQNAFANIAVPVIVNAKGQLEDINLQKILDIKPMKPRLKTVPKS